MSVESLLIDFSNNSSKKQSEIILERALELIIIMPGTEIGITYSANQKQAEDIREAHEMSVSGADYVQGRNQAEVVENVGWLLANVSKYVPLKTMFKIIPIATMTEDQQPVSDVQIKQDLNYAIKFANSAHLIIWGNPQAKIAIGGGMAQSIQPEQQSQWIYDVFNTMLEGCAPQLFNIEKNQQTLPGDDLFDTSFQKADDYSKTVNCVPAKEHNLHESGDSVTSGPISGEEAELGSDAMAICSLGIWLNEEGTTPAKTSSNHQILLPQ